MVMVTNHWLVSSLVTRLVFLQCTLSCKSNSPGIPRHHAVSMVESWGSGTGGSQSRAPVFRRGSGGSPAEDPPSGGPPGQILALVSGGGARNRSRVQTPFRPQRFSQGVTCRSLFYYPPVRTKVNTRRGVTPAAPRAARLMAAPRHVPLVHIRRG